MKNRDPKTAKKSEKRPRGRLKGTRITVQPLNGVSAMVERFSLTGTILTYQDVADALAAKTGLRVTRAAAWRLARDLETGKVPQNRNKLRAALGLPYTIPVNSCPKCGSTHLVKRPRHPKTFDENAREYDKWLLTHSTKLAARIAWAERKSK